MHLGYVATEKEDWGEAVRQFEKAKVKADSAEDDAVSSSSRTNLAGCLLLRASLGDDLVRLGDIRELCAGAKRFRKRVKRYFLEGLVDAESEYKPYVTDFLKAYEGLPDGLVMTHPLLR
jgi:hypothetical protein